MGKLFKKGHIPWNKGLKGVMPIPWNKGIKTGIIPKSVFVKGHKLTVTHGMRKTIFYSKWAGMKRRCFNKNEEKYPIYGGRGITVCKRWLKFENFRDDMYKPYLKHVEQYGKKQTSIERIDNDDNYKPSNCKWATQTIQQNNRSNNHLITYKEQTLTIAQWARKMNINNKLLFDRLYRYNWDMKRALTEPVKIQQ